MKYKDLKIGQLVYDQYGNEYEVLRLNGLPYFVEILCTKLVKKVEMCHDVILSTTTQVIHAINTEYFFEKYGLKTNETGYITIQSLKQKVEYVLNEKYIENRMDQIFSKVDKLEQYNSGENSFYLRKALCNFKDDLLDVIKILEKEQ